MAAGWGGLRGLGWTTVRVLFAVNGATPRCHGVGPEGPEAILECNPDSTLGETVKQALALRKL